MYQCLPRNTLSDFEGYQITAIRKEDIQLIRNWRNEQINVLRQQKPISEQEQIEYFNKEIWPSFKEKQPKQILFTLLHNNKCIGYGGLTHIDWISKRGEISFLLDPKRADETSVYQKDFRHFLNLLAEIAFKDLQLHRLLSETYEFRDSTIAVLEQFGFQKEGLLRDHVYKKEWYNSIMHGLLEKEWELETKGYPRLNVLITSISKKVPLIDAVRQAAKKISPNVIIHGCDSNPACIGQYVVDSFWNCPELDQMTPDDIMTYCLTNNIRVIIPTRNADLIFFADLIRLFKKSGISIMVSNLNTIETCLDKMVFADFLQRNHFPVIPTSTSLNEFKTPLYVVKERFGAGSQNIGLRLSEKDVIQHANTLSHPVFQPFVEGKEWSVDVYCNQDGTFIGAVARERNLVVAGESQITTTHAYPKLENLCMKMATALKISGSAVFQILEDSKHNFHVIECNPRFGGASTASIAVGLDVFYWFFLEILEKPIDMFQQREYEIQQIRYPKDLIKPLS